MKYNKLGNSTLEVSALGFGAMSLEEKNVDSSVSIIQKAYDWGINYFDTADIYADGANELLMGKAVKAFRKDIVLATKVGNIRSSGANRFVWDVSKKHINNAIDRSLKRLNTDYIDLYQVHGGTIEDNKDEVIETLERLKEEGKIRAYGLSSIRPNVFKYYASQGVIVSNMMQYSMLDTRPEEFLNFFEQNNVSVVARGVLAQGLLMDKPSKVYLDHSISTVNHAKNTLEELAQELGASSLAVALAYVLKNNTIGSALVGVRTQKHLETLMLAYQGLKNIKANKLDNLGAYSLYTAHRD